MTAKGIRVEDYANDITSGLVPFDELGILVVCRMYHIHIGIVLKDRVSYTSSGEGKPDCLFYLLFRGGVHYLDSCTGNWGYASPSRATLEDLTVSPQAKPMELVVPDKKNVEENPLHTPLNLSQPEPKTIDQKLEELSQELDLKAEKENQKRNRKRNLDQSMDSTSSSSSRKRRKRSSSMVLRSKNMSQNNRKKPKKRSSKTSRKAEENKLNIDLDSLLSKNRKRVAKPTDLKEKDPILDAFKDVQNEDELKTLLAPDDNTKSIAQKETIETDDGSMLLKSYGLKRTNKKNRNFACQEEGCAEVKKTQGELNRHLQFDHKLTFKCYVCDRLYDTANGRDKHFKKHYKFNNTCSECGYSCQFPGQMTVHKRKHTIDNAGKFPCPTRGCNKVLLSKATLDAHRKIHEDIKHVCEDCKKNYSTELRLKQHMQGKHGNGAITLCGIHYQWADSKYRHENGDCATCNELKKKQKEKPDYPHKIIIRTRKPKKLVVQVQTSQFRCICCGEMVVTKPQIVSCKYVFDMF